MLLEYNYDKGNLVLDMLKKSELATLNISKGRLLRDGDVTYVMEYTRIEDYPEPKQILIRKRLAESLPERLQLINVLNQFIENQSLNNITGFSLKFNAVGVRKCEITYSSSFKQKQEDSSLLEQLVNCLERYDRIVTQMGISNQEAKGVFRREGSGRNKKYVPLTIKDVGDALRQSLTEE